MSVPNFEMVLVGEMEEEKGNLMAETGFPLLSELCTESDDLLPLQEEVLDIKEEPLIDEGELQDTTSESWSMSPCPSDREQAVGVAFKEPEVLFVDPIQTAPRSRTRLVNRGSTRHLTAEKNSQLTYIKIKSGKPSSQVLKVQKRTSDSVQQEKTNNQSQILNNSLSRRVPSVPGENLPPHLLKLSEDLHSKKKSSSVNILAKAPTNKPIRTYTVGNRKKCSNATLQPIPTQSINHSKQKSVVQGTQPNILRKSGNLTTITGKVVCKTESGINFDPLAVDYHCINCNNDFDNPLFLMYHECTDPNFKFHCKMCPKKFISSKSLQNHFVKKHLDLNIVDDNLNVTPVIQLRRVEEWYTGKIYTPKPNLTCAVCKYVTESKNSLKHHINSHFKIKYFRCKFCDVKFLTKFKLIMHYKKIHSIQTSKNIFGKNATKNKNSENQFKCKTCNIKFKTSLAMQIHLKNPLTSCKTKPYFVHNKISKKKYNCKICNANFNCRSKMNSHIFESHRRQVLAQFCSQNTNIISDSESDDDLSLACKDCDFKCTSKSDLQNHVNFHLIFKFKCKHCGIFLMNESELEKHLKISHKSEETTTLEVDLHTEEIIPEREKNNSISTPSKQNIISDYSCTYCGTVYAYVSTLKYHQKMQHENEGDAKSAKIKKLTEANKKSTIKKQKIDKTIVKKSRKQKLTVKNDTNFEVISLDRESISSNTTQIQDNNESNQDAYSSGAENDDYQLEESTESTQENSDCCKTNKKADISHRKAPKIDTPSQLSASSLVKDQENLDITYVCGLCNIKFPTFINLYKHGEEHHEIIITKFRRPCTSYGSIKCKICKVGYNNMNSFRHHMLKHRGILPYQCKYCKKLMGTLQCLTTHQNICPKNTTKISSISLPFSGIQLFSCDLCEIYTLSIFSLYEHTQSVHSNNFVSIKVGKRLGGKYNCNECPEAFTELLNLRHHKIRHRNVKAFPCMFCTCKYSRLSVLYDHYRTSHNLLWKLSLKHKYHKHIKRYNYMFEGSNYVSLSEIDSEIFMVFNCHKCNIHFRTKSEIYNHCKENHDEVENKNFVCFICNKCFGTQIELKKHGKITHKSVKKNQNCQKETFYCDDCGSEFAKFSALKIHIASFTCKGNTHNRKRKATELKQTKSSKRLKTCLDLCDVETEGQKCSVTECSKELHERVENKETNVEKVSTNSQQNQSMKQTGKDGDNEETSLYFSESELPKGDYWNHKSGFETHHINEKCKKISRNNSSCKKKYWYVCNLCNIKFYTLRDVSKHSEENHEVTVKNINNKKQIGNGPYKCTVCNDGFAKLLGLQCHMLLHRNIRAFPCNYCDKSFTRSDLAMYHCKKYHTKLYKADCKKNKVQLKKGSKNKGSVISQTNNNKYVNTYTQLFACNICPIYFTDYRNLTKHAQKYHSDNFVQPLVLSTTIGLYKCDECHQSFTNEYNLHHHKFKHRNIKPFPCLFCTMFLTEYSYLYNHYRNCHNLEWKLHQKKKNRSKTSKFKNLRRTFMFEGSKYITLTEVKGKKLSFECHECKLIFNTRDEVLNHCKIRHSCNQGDTNGDTSKHGNEQLNYSPDKKNFCKYCGEAYSSWRTLNVHYWKEHESQRLEEEKKESKISEAENVIIEFCCDICDRKFDSYLELQKHQQVLHDLHTENMSELLEIPFYCGDCGQEFTHFEDLKKHISLSACKHGINSHDVRISKNGDVVHQLKEKRRESERLKTSKNPFGNSTKISSKTHEMEEITETHKGKESIDVSLQINKIEQIDSEEDDFSDSGSKEENFNSSVESESSNEISCEDLDSEEFKSQSPKPNLQTNNLIALYVCNLCNLKFNSLNDMCGHSEESHEVITNKVPTQKKFGTGPMKCTICDSGFASFRNLQLHLLAHRNVKPFPCKYCKKTFSTEGTLVYHCKKFHKEIYSEDYVNAMKLFVEKVSVKEKDQNKKYGRRKISEQIWNNNVNSYTLLFSCNICKFYYSGSKYLMEHAQKYHSNNFFQPAIRKTGDGPNKCDECVHTFKKKYDLKMHKLKHRDLRIFPCLFCATIFKDLATLTLHYQSCHQLLWKLHKIKKAERVISGPLVNVNKTYMFEGSKYITLTQLNKERLSFECHECKLVFETRDEAGNHCKTKHFQDQEGKNGDTSQLSCTKVNKICCKYCGETYSTWRLLDRHYWNNHESQTSNKKSSTCKAKKVSLEFSCDICDCSFKNKLKLSKHQKTLHGMKSIHKIHCKGPFYCNDCSQEFTNFAILKKHITSSTCKIDTIPLNLQTTTIDMVNTHKGKLFEVNETKSVDSKILKHCGDGLGNEPDAKDLNIGNNVSGDLLTSLPSDSQTSDENMIVTKPTYLFTCYNCNSLFDTKLKLKVHMKRHIKYDYHRVKKVVQRRDPSFIKLNCKVCNRTFKTANGVRDHVCINQVRIYTCVVCKTTFTSKNLYVLHKATHEREFICEVCGVGFFTNNRLKLHTIAKHEEPKYLCYLCGKKFPFQSTLNIHLKRHEKAEYSCKECDKKFFSFKESQQHYNMVHSAVCLFCKTCSQSFTRKDHLDEHERRHAKTDKTYKCEPCNKIFYSYSGHKFHNLNSHQVS